VRENTKIIRVRYQFYVKWVPCHHGWRVFRVADGTKHQTRRVAANIVNDSRQEAVLTTGGWVGC